MVGPSMQDDSDCPICLQLLYDPRRTICGHAFCSRCWERLAHLAMADSRPPTCPVCRTESVSGHTPERDPGLSALLKAQYPEEWLRRHANEIADERSRARGAAEPRDDEVALALAEEMEAEEAELSDGSGRRSRRMTAGLLRRQAREQCTFRTVTLISKLELTLCGLRDISPTLQEYNLITTLRLEHNYISNIDGLHLPVLRTLYIGHNRLERLGDGLRGTPHLLLLDVRSNRLTSLDGLAHCAALSTLHAASNLLADSAALEPLASCAALSTIELHSNPLATLDHLQPLAALSELRSLRISDTPLAASVGRGQLTERLPQLRVLDGGAANGQVQRDERRAMLSARQESILRSQVRAQG